MKPQQLLKGLLASAVMAISLLVPLAAQAVDPAETITIRNTISCRVDPSCRQPRVGQWDVIGDAQAEKITLIQAGDGDFFVL